MDEFNHEHLPDDLRELGERLRREAVRPTAAELDQIKLRAMRTARTRPAGQKGPLMRSRLATLLTIGVLTAGAGGTFAIAGGGGNGDNGSAASGQYKPGKGCGDKNHTHERENECKKPPK